MSLSSAISLYQHLKTKDVFVFLDQIDDQLILLNKVGKKISLAEAMFEEVEGLEDQLTRQQVLAFELYLQADDRPIADNSSLRFEYFSRNLKVLCSELLKWGYAERKLNKFEREFLKSQIESKYHGLTEKQTRVVFDIFLAASSAGFSLKEDEFDYLVSTSSF